MTKYFYPEYKNYHITSKGKIYNSKTEQEIKGMPTKGGYIRISIRPKGKKTN